MDFKEGRGHLGTHLRDMVGSFDRFDAFDEFGSTGHAEDNKDVG
jgi:hypothetical protein